MRFFRSKSKPAPLTLKGRVEEFWKWFASNADRFQDTIEDKRCADLQPETSEAVDKWLGGMAWVYGAGENGVGHSLTLSGEAFIPRQFVADYWASRAPRLEGWTFYSSRQPSDGAGGIILHLGEAKEDFKPGEFWVTPRLNEGAEKIALSVWHPSLHRLPESTRFMALFLILDELLGEHGTQNWIGEIDFSEDNLKKAVPIIELPDLIRNTEQDQGWRKDPPTETYFSYQLNPQDTHWLRGDTVAGTTRCFRLLGDYLEAKGPCDHPFPGVGLDYVFVSVPTSHFPDGEEVNFRGALEDEIAGALEADAAGISFGGATGTRNCYLDFAIYDGDRSLDIIKTILRRNSLPGQTRIHFFTSDRAKEVIRI